MGKELSTTTVEINAEKDDCQVGLAKNKLKIHGRKCSTCFSMLITHSGRKNCPKTIHEIASLYTVSPVTYA